MTDTGASALRPSRLDRGRAWLGIGLAVAVVAAYAAGKAGVAAVSAVTLLQWLNARLGRRDSATRHAGRDRFAPDTAEVLLVRRVPRAAALFLLEEQAALGTSLWALVQLCWAVGIPVHPLLYAVMLLLVSLVLLVQLYPQLRIRRPPAAQRAVVHPSSRELH